MDNKKEDGIEQSVPSLNILRLRPQLGELNYILKDYGVCIVITCDKETGDVIINNGKADVTIGEPRLWFEL